MFRLFRRRKKEKKDKEIERAVETISETTDGGSIQPPLDTPPQDQTETITEMTQADKIVAFSKSITESIPEVSIPEVLPEKPDMPIIDFWPTIKSIVETETSIQSFISPEIFIQENKVMESTIESYKPVELIPISLEERIEGALFSVGRPIHTSELIENLQEESPLV